MTSDLFLPSSHSVEPDMRLRSSAIDCWYAFRSAVSASRAYLSIDPIVPRSATVALRSSPIARVPRSCSLTRPILIISATTTAAKINSDSAICTASPWRIRPRIEGLFDGFCARSIGTILSALGARRPRYAARMECSHLDQIEVLDVPAAVAGCEECLATGGTWVHLRMCQTCGHIGCCDNSPGRHATAHFNSTSHPIIRSAQPGENWSW